MARWKNDPTPPKPEPTLVPGVGFVIINPLRTNFRRYERGNERYWLLVSPILERETGHAWRVRCHHAGTGPRLVDEGEQPTFECAKQVGIENLNRAMAERW